MPITEIRKVREMEKEKNKSDVIKMILAEMSSDKHKLLNKKKSVSQIFENQFVVCRSRNHTGMSSDKHKLLKKIKSGSQFFKNQ